MNAPARQLVLSHAGRPPTFAIEAINAAGETVPVAIPCEHPLTLYVDKREVVTLMTLGADPEALTLGYLSNKQLIDAVRERQCIYRQAGSVHGCALARNSDDIELLYFIEDVGRHNAVDAIAGRMWLDGESGADKVFHGTGRLTSEMVIKAAQMGIPFLVSRSGVTQMAWGIAQNLGLTLIGRARNRQYLIHTGAERFLR